MGIHTGRDVLLRFCPAPPNSGICFERIDLPGRPRVPANVDFVQDTSRCTTIGIGKVQIHTVEHVLSALAACQIDNLVIQVTEAEPPIGDGSSLIFLEMIEQAGIAIQEEEVEIQVLQEPLFYEERGTHLVALPAEEFRISYTLHYPQTPVIRSQYYSFQMGPGKFKEEIASCRTFALYEEITALMEKGLIRGGSLDNAVIIKDDVIFSKDGLRFPDEPVRHKILDIIGDLYLIGIPFLAHIMAIRSGHRSNVALGKKIMNYFMGRAVYAEK